MGTLRSSTLRHHHLPHQQIHLLQALRNLPHSLSRPTTATARYLPHNLSPSAPHSLHSPFLRNRKNVANLPRKRKNFRRPATTTKARTTLHRTEAFLHPLKPKHPTHRHPEQPPQRHRAMETSSRTPKITTHATRTPTATMRAWGADRGVWVVPFRLRALSLL